MLEGFAPSQRGGVTRMLLDWDRAATDGRLPASRLALTSGATAGAPSGRVLQHVVRAETG